MKDLGEIHWVLNLKIEWDRDKWTLSISQSAYIDKIMCQFNLQEAKTFTSPLDPNIKLSKDQCLITQTEKEEMKKVPSWQTISSLTWTAVATQPDIAFSIPLLPQFLETPGCVHWNAVKRVFQYLKGTKDNKPTQEYSWRIGQLHWCWLGIVVEINWASASVNLSSSVCCLNVLLDEGAVGATTLAGWGGSCIDCLAAACFAASFHVVPFVVFSACHLVNGSITVMILHFTKFLTVHQRTWTRYIFIRGVLNDSSEHYSKEYHCLGKLWSHACMWQLLY